MANREKVIQEVKAIIDKYFPERGGEDTYPNAVALVDHFSKREMAEIIEELVSYQGRTKTTMQEIAVIVIHFTNPQ